MFKRGQTVANRYVIRDLVGRGGMGRIYKVYDKALGEEVALKTLLPEYVKDRMIMERFFNEARIARGLSHPNIIRVHDIGGTEGTVYISMEFLEGKSLRELLDDLKPGQRLPINGILRMFDGLCAALEYAHEFTIHRDIKPENVMILPDGSVKLMDFGISKLKSNPNLTSASMVMGTPHYMSPEQLKHTSKVDARADIYSMGVMLYEVITGIKPTALGKAASEVRREVPPAIDPIIEKCVNASAAKRYQSVGDLRQALRTIRIALETQTPQKGSARVASSGEGQVARVAAGVVLLVAILAGAAFGVAKAEERRKELRSNVAVEAAPNAPQPLAKEDHDYEWVAAAASRARERASKALIDFPQKDRDGVLQRVLGRGDMLLSQARAASGAESSRAVELASDALSCFLAPLVWPEGMVFVPPGLAVLEDGAGGRIPTRVEGFFIDRAEVRAGAFSDFCQSSEGWRWPIGASSNGLSVAMSSLTFYDALAFVATRRPPKRLPTEAQWMRSVVEGVSAGAIASAEEGVPALELRASDPDEESDDAVTATRRAAQTLYMQGQDFSEWTRSLSTELPGHAASTKEAAFGSTFITRGGSFDERGHYRMAQRASMVFESASPWVGFRGVVELPASIEDRVRLAGVGE